MTSARNDSLFAALRAAFPADLDATAIETTAPDGTPLYYTWRDIDRASPHRQPAGVAPFCLRQPRGGAGGKVGRGHAAVPGYAARGLCLLAAQHGLPERRIEYFIGNAEPAVVVCTPGQFRLVSKIAFTAGTRHVFTLGENRDGSLLERAAHHADTHEMAPRARTTWPPSSTPAAPRPQQGRHADARQPAVQRGDAE